MHENYILPTNWPVRSKSGYWKRKNGIIWYLVGKKIRSNSKTQDCTSSEQLDKSWWAALHAWVLVLPSKWKEPIKQATAWLEWSLGDVTLTLSLIWIINWVMNACLLISSAIDIYVYKDKLQIALWNKCEEYIAPNHTWLT